VRGPPVYLSAGTQASLTATSSRFAVQRTAVYDVYPSAGPDSGGTLVRAVGEGFDAGLRCRFHNGTAAVAVKAAVLDALTVGACLSICLPVCLLFLEQGAAL
jgi:hypothetical protein